MGRIFCILIVFAWVGMAKAEVQVAFRFEAVFGEIGGGDGQFLDPEGLTLDTSGNVFVVDTGNDRVQKLSPTGTFLRAVGDRAGKMGNLINRVVLPRARGWRFMWLMAEIAAFRCLISICVSYL